MGWKKVWPEVRLCVSHSNPQRLARAAKAVSGSPPRNWESKSFIPEGGSGQCNTASLTEGKREKKGVDP